MFDVVFYLGGWDGGVVVWLKITSPVPLMIKVSLLVSADRSPCLMSWLTYQSKSVLGGPSGTRAGGAGGGLTGFVVLAGGGVGFGGGPGGTGVVLFYITPPVLLRIRLSLVIGFAISPGLISVDIVQSKFDFGGPSGIGAGRAGEGGEGGVVLFTGGGLGLAGGDGGTGVVLFWITPPVLLSTKLSWEAWADMSLTVIKDWTPQEKFDVLWLSGRTSLSTLIELGVYYTGALVLVFDALFEGEEDTT